MRVELALESSALRLPCRPLIAAALALPLKLGLELRDVLLQLLDLALQSLRATHALLSLFDTLSDLSLELVLDVRQLCELGLESSVVLLSLGDESLVLGSLSREFGLQGLEGSGDSRVSRLGLGEFSIPSLDLGLELVAGGGQPVASVPGLGKSRSWSLTP